jgi:histidinol-phosphate aminotransferase
MNDKRNNKVRKTVREFAAYEWEASSAAIAKRFGLRAEEIKRFDTNTSPFQPRLEIDYDSGLNEYPDPSYAELAKAIADYASCGVKQIVIGAGADEILDVIAKTFVDNGDAAVVSTPTYSMYRIVVEQMGGKTINVPREPDFSVDNRKMLEAAEKSKVIFVCNPNNPTGNATPLSQIKELCEAATAPVVVDEAYYEFCGETLARSAIENAIVVRTFSKAFSLAGARVGYAVASEEIAAQMNKVRPPNSASALSIRLALKALENRDYAKENVEKIIEERKRLQKDFEQLGLLVYPSQTNFLLVKFENEDAAQRVFESLLSRGIVTRNFSRKITGCLRFTVRSPSDNDLLLSAVEEVLGK